MSAPQLANCDRCHRQLQVAKTRKENSRPFRKSLVPKGLCPECVVTEFLYNTYPVNMIIDQAGPELLLKGGVEGWSDSKVPGGVPFVAQALVSSGLMDECEMSIHEIDWDRVVSNWMLPVKVEKKNPMNPYRMGDSKRHAARPRRGVGLPEKDSIFGLGSLVVRRDSKTGELTVNGKPVGDTNPELADSIEGLMGELKKREDVQ